MDHLRPAARRALLAAALAAGILVLTAASASAEPWVFSTASSSVELINQLFWLTLVLATIVFVLVEALLLYSSLRFRRHGPLPAHEPPQIHGNTRLEAMWAVVPALILIGLFGVSARTMNALNAVPSDGLRVEVTGQQFQWNFRYPDAGVATVNELRIPVGVPVILEITSRDVIHGFWVPDLAGKIDANPGRVNRLSFTANAPGTFRGVCAELCGAGHGNMLFRVEAVPRGDFDRWLQEQQASAAQPAAPAATPAGAAAPAELATAGRALLAQKGCGGCHVIPGVPGAAGTVGPSLAGIAGRTTIAGGAVPVRSPDDLKRWILNPAALKPGTAMPNLGLSDDEATKIVAYLETLKE